LINIIINEKRANRSYPYRGSDKAALAPREAHAEGVAERGERRIKRSGAAAASDRSLGEAQTAGILFLVAKNRPCERREEGPRDEVRWERAHEQPMASDRKAKSHPQESPRSVFRKAA